MLLQEVQISTIDNTCCHHWMIQTAEGPVSSGICRYCMESREFNNSIDDWDFAQRTPEPLDRGFE